MGKTPFSNPKLSKKRRFPLTSQPILDADESPALIQPAVSDDASSISRRPPVGGGGGGGGGGNFIAGSYVAFNVASCSKNELLELKNRLFAELEQIRRLKKQIDASDYKIRSSNSNTKPPTVTKNNSKKVAGNKQPFPASNGGAKGLNNAQLMKNCGQILTKLMKHKHGYIFNSPVDVVTLKLHDYYDVIKHPMDLGTVKTRLGKNMYGWPRDFAEDVRLTFTNAMKYNPKGHEVYVLAEQLLLRFEELYRPIKESLGDEVQPDIEEEQDHVGQEVEASSWDHVNSYCEKEINGVQTDKDNVKQAVPASGLNQNQDLNPQPQPTTQLPVRTPSPVRAPTVKPLKQPKPKAKEPNKREMSMEEKQKLGIGLQSLPQEKMEQVIHIIRKRNGDLRQDGDEIELDIETVDTETLWELDRFVTNYKKMVSKMKRQALMGINSNVDVAAGNSVPPNEGNKDVPESERVEITPETKKPRKGETGDEDVDIGDEMPMSGFPPVEIEKDNGHVSGSSSSSSSSSDDSSSSSGSDSGSSSGSESEDADS